MILNTEELSKSDIIDFVKLFNFELDVAKWDNVNSALVQRPFMRFKYDGEGIEELDEPIPLVIYNDDGFEDIIIKINKTLRLLSEKNKARQITKLIISL